MDDDNGLELSLGLSCGGFSAKSKRKDVTSDPKGREGSNSKVLGGSTIASDVLFNVFFRNNTEKHDQNGKRTFAQPQENFWTDLGQCSAPVEEGSDNAQSTHSQFITHKEPVIRNTEVADAEEEKSSLKKLRLFSEEISFQKRHEKIADYAKAVGKGSSSGLMFIKGSHASFNADDVSTGENEDVAESETEGSNSWLVSQREDSIHAVAATPDRCAINHTAGVDLQEHNRHSYTRKGSNSDHGKVAYGIPFSLQPLAVMNVPFANGEQPMVQAMNSNNMHVAFGYSSVQLPALQTNPSWAFSSRPQDVSYDNRAPSLQNTENDATRCHASAQITSSSNLAFEGNPPEMVKAGSSSSLSHAGESKGDNTIFSQKDLANQTIIEGFPNVIQHGIAPDVKFGGCGSYPNLPWVSTRGSGPNGRAISGVTYKYSKDQVKIVCACHGTHMSREEFIQHANVDTAGAGNGSVNITTFNPSNSAASAQN